MDETIEIEITKCPFCGKEVTSYWVKNGGGLISDPAYDIIGDEILHSECWNKQVREYNTDKEAE